MSAKKAVSKNKQTRSSGSDSVPCCGSFGRVHILDAGTYQPGDLPPEGYLQWHEWAEVQRKAEIKQVECGYCSKWQTPQELSGEKLTMKARTSKGDEVTLEWAVCTKCAAKHHSLHNVKHIRDDG